MKYNIRFPLILILDWTRLDAIQISGNPFLGYFLHNPPFPFVTHYGKKLLHYTYFSIQINHPSWKSRWMSCMIFEWPPPLTSTDISPNLLKMKIFLSKWANYFPSFSSKFLKICVSVRTIYSRPIRYILEYIALCYLINL